MYKSWLGSELSLAAVGSKVSRSGSRWWTGASGLLFLGLLLQLAWFNAREVMLQLPALRPSVEQICAALGCEVLAPRDPRAIKILARDVREHPKLKGMLLVNLTLSNGAKAAQAFPLLQLDLMDVTGRAVASRRFERTNI
jgi:Protein of unknown function (DUF3426)